MDTPTEKLCARILARLVKERLLSEPEAEKLRPRLAEGKLRAEDWRLAIEISSGKEGGK
jgi:hypothetical protein